MLPCHGSERDVIADASMRVVEIDVALDNAPCRGDVDGVVLLPTANSSWRRRRAASLNTCSALTALARPVAGSVTTV